MKDVLDLLQHLSPLTRAASLRALHGAVRNVIKSVLWSTGSSPTVIGALRDEDKRVRVAAIVSLSNVPSGNAEAIRPLLKCLEDPELNVRNPAADVIARSLTRQDLQLKLEIISILRKYSSAAQAVTKGFDVGGKYLSLEVGFTGRKDASAHDICAAAFRVLRGLGIPENILKLGANAIEAAVERHAIGFRYELPPNFMNQHGEHHSKR
eukprot:748400-Hanusia_phi.AAC.18